MVGEAFSLNNLPDVMIFIVYSGSNFTDSMRKILQRPNVILISSRYTMYIADASTPEGFSEIATKLCFP